MAVALGLAAAFGFGLADFIGGMQTRRHPVLVVVGISQTAALVVASIALLIVRQPLPSVDALVLGFLSGVAVFMGVTAYYRGLAVGPMGVVSPIAATAVAVPLGVGLVMGDDLSAVQAVGIALAIAGVIAIGYRPTGKAHGGRLAVGVGLGLLAAMAIGIYYPLIDATAERTTLLWVVFLNRLGALTTVAAVIYPAVSRGWLPQRSEYREGFTRTDVAYLLAIGVISVTSIGLLAAATTKGALAIVSVLAAMFPVTTILLARIILGERLAAVQRLAATIALVGVALIAL